MHRMLTTVLVGTLLAGGSVPAAAASPSSSEVRTFPGPGSVVAGAHATLVRQHDGISFTLDGRDLVADHAYTIWFVAFNRPQECTAPMTDGTTLVSLCGVSDLLQDRGEPTAVWSAGHVVGRSGRSTWGGRLAVGDISGCTERQQLACNDGLTDVQAAEVHLVLRSHGPAIPEMVDAQISSFNEGCYPGQPNAEPAGVCRNVQFAAFMP